MIDEENPSKRKVPKGIILKMLIKEIRKCEKCEFVGFGEEEDLLIPCSIHKEKVRDLI